MNLKNVFANTFHSLITGVMIGFAGYILGLIFGEPSKAILWGLFAGFFAYLHSELTMLLIHIAKDVNEMKNIIVKMDSSVIAPTKDILSKAAAEKKQQNYNETVLKNGGWKCKNCGKANPAYTGTCSCGNSKY